MAGAFEKHNGCDLDQQNVFANYTAQATRHGKTTKAAAKSANVQRVCTNQDTKDAHDQHAEAFAALRPRVYGAAKAGLYEDVYDARNAMRTLYINLFDGPDGLNDAAILAEQQRVHDLQRRHNEALEQHRKATEEASQKFRAVESKVEQRYKKQVDELKNKLNRRLQDLRTEHQRQSGEAADLAGKEMQRQLDLLARKHRDDRHKLKLKLRDEAEAKSNEQLKTVKDGHVTAVKKLWDHLDDRNRTVKEKSRADARTADQRLQEAQRQHDAAVKNMGMAHGVAMEKMSKQHETAVTRLREVQNQELERLRDDFATRSQEAERSRVETANRVAYQLEALNQKHEEAIHDLRRHKDLELEHLRQQLETNLQRERWQLKGFKQLNDDLQQLLHAAQREKRALSTRVNQGCLQAVIQGNKTRALDRRVTSLDSEVSTLRRDNVTAAEQLATLLEKYKKSKEEGVTKSTDLEHLATKLLDISSAAREREKALIAELGRREHDFTDEMHGVLQELEDTRARLQASEAQKDSMRAQHTHLVKRLLASKKCQIDNLNAAFNSLRTAKDQSIAEALDKNKHLAEQVEIKDVALNKSGTTVEQLEAKIKQSEAQALQLHATIVEYDSALAEQHHEHQQSQVTLTARTTELALQQQSAYESRLKSARESHGETRRQLTNMRHELVLAQEQATSVKLAHENVLAQYIDTTVDLLGRVEELQRRESSMTRSHDDLLSQHASTITELLEMVADLQTRETSMQTSHEEIVKQQKATIDELHGRIAELNSNNLGLRNELDESRDHAAAVLQQTNGYKTALTVKDGQNAALVHRLDRAKERHATLRDLYAANVVQSQDEVDKWQDKVKEVEQRLSSSVAPETHSKLKKELQHVKYMLKMEKVFGQTQASALETSYAENAKLAAEVQSRKRKHRSGHGGRRQMKAAY